MVFLPLRAQPSRVTQFYAEELIVFSLCMVHWQHRLLFHDVGLWPLSNLRSMERSSSIFAADLELSPSAAGGNIMLDICIILLGYYTTGSASIDVHTDLYNTDGSGCVMREYNRVRSD